MTKSIWDDEVSTTPKARSIWDDDEGGAPAAKPERTLGGTVKDAGISLLKGAIAVPEAAVGLADIVTGGKVGKFLENKDGIVGFRPKEAKAMLDEHLSDAQKAANAEVEKAEGFMGTAKAALQNPSVIAHAGVESLPSIGAGGVVGRGVAAVAPRLAGAGAAAIGEGAISAGSTAESVRQQTADGELTAKQSGIAASSGVLVGLLGAAGGKVAKSMGIGDIDSWVAKVPEQPAAVQKGLVRRILSGAIAEGVLEEMPQSMMEQAAENISLGKAWDEGLGKSAAMGALTGGAMGAGMNIRGKSDPTVTEQIGPSTITAPQAAVDEIKAKAPAQEPGKPTPSQVMAANAFADVGGDEGIQQRRTFTQGLMALSLSQIEQQDGEEALVRAIEHLSAGDAQRAEQLYEASQSEDLVAAGRQGLAGNAMDFIQINDGIRSELGLGLEEQAATQPGEAVPDVATLVEQVAPEALQAQVDAVRQGLVAGAVLPTAAAETLDVNGLQLAEVIGADGQPRYVVARDVETVQQAVARSFEVGPDQMAAELFAPAQGKAVVQQIDPTTGEVVEEAVVSPSEVDAARDRTGRRSTHVRPVADVLAERLPAAPAAPAQAAVADEPAVGLSRFFSRAQKAPRTPAQFEPTEPSGDAEAFVESLNKGLRLQGDSAVDPASIVEVKPSRELAKMGSAIKAMFGTNVVFIHTPKGLLRKNGEVFNRFHGAASGDKNTLFLNVESDHALSTLGHELAHVLEKQHPDIYEKLEITVLSRMRAGAARELQGLLAQAAQAESLDKGTLALQFRKEVVADAIGEMANDETFWKDVFSNVGRERTLAKQLYDAVLDVIAKLQRALTRGGYIKGVKDVAQVKKAIQSAYKEWAQRYETQGEDVKHLTPEEAGMYAELLAHAARDEAATEEKPTPKTEKPARPAKPAPVTENQPVAEKATPEPKSEQAEQPAAAPAAPEPAAPVAGGTGGSASTVAVDSRTQPGTRGGSLEGLAAEVRVNGQLTKFGGFKPAQQAARKYAAKAGIKYAPPKKYVTVDPTRAKRIADAFEAMPHNPTDPEVKASYDAMIKETIAQWEAIKATGLKVEFITGEDPYGNPRNAIIDVVQNNHLWVFPTSEGFGGTESAKVDISGNPLLAVVPGEKISGRPVQANDIFRIVHDYFGHIKEGVGFRADGEENAWRAHMAMYSPLARKAATTETRGQNSWVNYGPFAEQNRTANGVETQYAPQKIGLLPDWVVEDGRTDEPYVAPVEPKPVKREAPVEPAEPEHIPEEAFVEEEEAPDAPVSFSRNPLKMESVQEALDFTSTTKLPYQLGDALDRGQWADAYVLAKSPDERKQLLANLGTKLVEWFADSKVRLSKWIAGLPIADVVLLQRLEGDLRRSDTVRSDLEGYVKEKFTEPMMTAITKASKQTKLSSDQVKKLAGYWMAARYAPEASAQLIAKDRTALALAQASGDATAIAQAQQNLNDRILSVNGNIGDAKIRGVAGGMNNAEAAQLVQNVEAKIPVQLLEDIAKPIYAMLDWKKQRDLATGKVTQTQVNSWLNSPRYVPLTGDPRADRETTDVFSAGGQLNQDQDHAMNGRKDSVADDGIDAAFTATIKTINFTAMQDFKRSLNKVYEHARASGLDIGLTREAVTGIVRTGDDVVIYRDTQKRANGTEFTAAHAFRFRDQRIIEALKKDNVEHLNSALKVISAPTRWYARAVTQFMPMFAPINLVRDIWERSEVLRTKVIYAADGSVVDVKKAARASIADVINPALWKASMMKAFKRGGMTPVRGELEEMIRLGGSSTTGDFLDRSSGDLEATIRGDASKLGHAANKTLEVVTRWNDIFEVIPSLAIYRSLKAQGVKAEDAAAAVLDLMNFRKKGTVMPAVRAFYVFAQPAATSGYNLAKYLSTSTGRKRFAAQALLATALYAMLKGAWGDDEDEELGNKLDNLSNYTVERSIPIKVGDYVVKIPVGFGPPQLAWATGGIVNRFASGRYSAGDAVGELAKGWTKSFVPVAPSDMELSKRPVDWFISTFTPTIAKPLFNIYADQTSFGAPLTPAFKNPDKLKADQAKRTTPQAYTDLAREVYEMTGVDLYPDHIKAMADGYLVGPLREIMSLTIEADAKAMRGEPQRVPLVASFVDVINDRSILNQIHSRVRADLDKNHRTITHLRETGDEDGKITPEMEDMEKAYKRFMATEKVLGMQRSALKKMDLDDEERAERTRSIEERADSEHRRLLVEYLGS